MSDSHLSRDAYNQNTFLSRSHRKALRLPRHDYSGPSVYHVILCAKGIAGREPLFAQPVLDQILKIRWLGLTARFPSIQLDEFVIMPDHIHFLLWVNKWPDRVQGDRPPYLWEIIQAYKSQVAVDWLTYIKSNHPDWSARIWQKKYYERIIHVDELNHVRRYIRENPDHARHERVAHDGD